MHVLALGARRRADRVRPAACFSSGPHSPNTLFQNLASFASWPDAAAHVNAAARIATGGAAPGRADVQPRRAGQRRGTFDQAVCRLRLAARPRLVPPCAVAAALAARVPPARAHTQVIGTPARRRAVPHAHLAWLAWLLSFQKEEGLVPGIDQERESLTNGTNSK
jgi:hypothetical protein